jgi:RNA polymerase sigma-70 factor, ECF subfamily
MPDTTVRLRRTSGQPLGLATIYNEAKPEDSRVLVQRVQGGDVDAFGELYRLYRPVVRRYVSPRVEHDPHLVEDLVADVFCRAWANIGSFSWRGIDVGAWLVTIARNRVADHFKCSRTKLEIVSDDLCRAEQVDPRADTEASALATLTGQAVRRAVAELTPDQRRVVRLRFLRDHAPAEVAETMGRSRKSVTMLQRRALQTLARHLPAEVAS